MKYTKLKGFLGALALVGVATGTQAAGLLTNDLPLTGRFTGTEVIPADTNNASGAYPQSVGISLQQLAAGLLFLSNNADVVGIAGQRFTSSYYIGTPSGQFTAGGNITLTGIAVNVGTTGGTDKFIVELHNAAGATVATSDTSGTTAGTASTWQKIAFTAPVSVAPGQYFLTLQSNGTTAKFRAYNTAGINLLTQSAAGTFGTTAAITPPTTYTASVGPVAVPY